ncbi:hypothetical protein ASE52_16115 [Acidovorax sp. Root275]|uniref:hypothetical protein n=1 Tax=Acidovorax sp. Root275 TaxID=1736508 RepID=UPI000709C38A|nr:hypothetical protein [Acidovorax sp. Root275]KRD46211.1 hypothetical protein ASE52_16115 [Acidovorax sp. Root275]
MTIWQSATLEEVEQLLADGLAAVHPLHRQKFDAIRITPRSVPVADTPGEFVYVVAEYQEQLLYYSDIEDGWELGVPNLRGGISSRGCNQLELSHVMHLIFGDPDS